MSDATVHLVTRHPELDSFNHINNANYLRYVEHARTVVYERLGFKIDKFLEAGMQIVVSSIDSYYRIPLGHSQRIRIVTELADARKIRGKLRQTIYADGSQKPAFYCDTYWALLPESGHKRPDNEVRSEWFGTVDKLPKYTGPASKRPIFPTPGIDGGVGLSLRAEPWHLDSFGHVNNAVYANYLESGRWALFDSLGFAHELSESAGAGFGLILSRQTIEYERPIYMFDEMEVRSIVAGLSKVRLSIFQEIYNKSTGQLCTSAMAEVVGVNFTTGRPAPFPDELRKRITK